MSESRYTGYYTARVIWHKDYQWGDLLFGAGRSWFGRGAEGGAYRRNHKLYVTVGGSTSRTHVSTEGAREYDGHDVAGHVSFIPAERRNRGHYEGGFLDTVSLEISPEFLGKCMDGGDPATIEFVPATNHFDPLLFHTMVSLKEEAESGGFAGRLFVETTATFIALHLLRQYSNVGFDSVRREQSAAEKKDLTRAIEFIEENLGDELSLHAIATVARVPVSTFARAFSRAMKVPPHKFVMLRRVERAKQLLSSRSLPIADIAYQLGFASQSHFSTVFRAYVGESPARFRQILRRR